MNVTVQIDMSAVQGRLRALADLAFLRPAMDGIADDLAAEVAQGFKAQRDPWGAAWKPLKPATLRARRQGRGGGAPQILRDTGVLQNSISSRRTGPLVVEIGTTTPYAAIHQFGGTINVAARAVTVRLRTVKNANGKKVSRFASARIKRARDVTAQVGAYDINIPARPFLPIRNGAIDLPPTWATAIQSRIRAAFEQAGA